MEKVTDFIWGDPQITADDCRHEIKRPLLLGRRAMTNVDSLLKSRDIALPTKAHLVKAIPVFLGFPGGSAGKESKKKRKKRKRRSWHLVPSLHGK